MARKHVAHITGIPGEDGSRRLLFTPQEFKTIKDFTNKIKHKCGFDNDASFKMETSKSKNFDDKRYWIFDLDDIEDLEDGQEIRIRNLKQNNSSNKSQSDCMNQIKTVSSVIEHANKLQNTIHQQQIPSQTQRSLSYLSNTQSLQQHIYPIQQQQSNHVLIHQQNSVSSSQPMLVQSMTQSLQPSILSPASNAQQIKMRKYQVRKQNEMNSLVAKLYIVFCQVSKSLISCRRQNNCKYARSTICRLCNNN